MENMSFEEAMKRLEEITGIIQKNECSLDEGLKLYQEGVDLARYCSDKLNAFSRKLEEIATGENGNE